MNRREAIARTPSLCASLGSSPPRPLRELPAATLHVGRVSLAEIGRRLPGAAALVFHDEN